MEDDHGVMRFFIAANDIAYLQNVSGTKEDTLAWRVHGDDATSMTQEEKVVRPDVDTPAEFYSGTASVRGILAMLVGFEAPVDDLLTSVGIERAVLEDDDGRITHKALVLLWNETARALGDQYLGIHAAQWVDRAMELGAFGVVDFIASHSKCVEEALRKYCRYNQVMSYPYPRDEITIVGDSMLFTRHLPDTSPELLRQATECFFASLVLRIRRLTGIGAKSIAGDPKPQTLNQGHAIVPLEVRFRHDPPDDLGKYDGLFGERVVFGADVDRMAFDKSIGNLPLLTANSWLCEILEQHTRDLLQAQQLVGKETSSEVRRILLRGPRASTDVKEIVHDLRHSPQTKALEMPEISEVARLLGTSERTMQRRLSAEGTSYQEILDDVRRDLAARYVRERSMSLTEIAFLLGYSTEATFHQAFKRWYGRTPGSFRRS